MRNPTPEAKAALQRKPVEMKTLTEELQDMEAEITRLKARNAALVECLLGSRCPVDSRVTVANCQQCGCTHGMFARGS